MKGPLPPWEGPLTAPPPPDTLGSAGSEHLRDIPRGHRETVYKGRGKFGGTMGTKNGPQANSSRKPLGPWAWRGEGTEQSAQAGRVSRRGAGWPMGMQPLTAQSTPRSGHSRRDGLASEPPALRSPARGKPLGPLWDPRTQTGGEWVWRAGNVLPSASPLLLPLRLPTSLAAKAPCCMGIK